MDLKELSLSIQKGDANKAKELVKLCIEKNINAELILNEGLISAMDEIGVKFKNNDIYVPEVLIAARAMNAAMQILEPVLIEAGVKNIGKAVIGTVKGDLHDIGKNQMCIRDRSLTAISPTNIVCPEANLKAEIRSRDESKLNFYTEKMIDELKKACNKFGAKLEHSCSAVYNSYKIDENDEFVIFVEEKCKEMEITSITKEYTGGGSDANIFNENGIKTLNISTGMEKEHTCSERISIKNLELLTELVLKLMIV